MKGKNASMFWYISMILIAAGSRLIPHWPNVTAVGAVALVGAAYYSRSIWAYLVPLLALWFSDMILNNVVYAEYAEGFTFLTLGSLWIYAATILIVPLLRGVFKNKKSPLQMLVGSVGAGVLFYLVTNFGTWIGTSMYPKTGAGLISCMAAGLPFLRNTLLANLVFVAALFPLYEWYKDKYLATELTQELA